MMKLLGIILLSLVCLGQADDPRLTITETDPQENEVEGMIIQRKTKDVQLTCTVENKPLDSEVQWTKKVEDGEEVQISTATRTYDPYKWSIDNPTSTAWRLRIQNVEESDEGTYSCKVSINSQNYNTAGKSVGVIELPEISDLTTSNDMNKNAGGTAVFRCYATGRPTPLVKWTRLAGELLPNGGTEYIGNVLEVQDIRSNDAGIYKCTATNSAGFDEKQIRLTVSYKPEVTSPTRIVKQKAGYPVVLSCSVRGYPQPSPNSINWMQNNRPIRSEGRFEIRNIAGAYNKISSRLLINPVEENDFGEYRCEATNEKGADFTAMNLVSSDVPIVITNYNFGGASTLTVSLGTVFMMICVWFVQRLGLH